MTLSYLRSNKEEICITGHSGQNVKTSQEFQQMKIDWKLIRGLSPPNKVDGHIQMNRRVPEFFLDFGFENFGFLPAPAKHTGKKPRGIRVDGLHLLNNLIPSDFLKVFIFGPCADWKLCNR